MDNDEPLDDQNDLYDNITQKLVTLMAIASGNVRKATIVKIKLIRQANGIEVPRKQSPSAEDPLKFDQSLD